ncbi:MAG: flavin reductase family protein [Solirubrobacterales bacterium]
MSPPDEQEFRRTVGLMPSGVTVVAALGPEGPTGATASAVCSLSLRPMMMLVCLDRDSRTLGAVRQAERFSINVLCEDQRREAELFASKVEQGEKWAAVTWHGEPEVPLIEGCPATVVCRRVDMIPAGDHVIVTGEVLEVDYEAGGAEPLVYHGGLFRTLDPAPGDG